MVASKLVTEFTVKGADRVVQALQKQQKQIKENTGTYTKGMVALSAAISGVVTIARGLQGIAGWIQEGVSSARELTKQMALLELSLGRIPETANQISFGQAQSHMEALFQNSTLARGEVVRINAAIARTTKDTQLLMEATQATVDLLASRPEMGAAGGAQWMTTLLGDPSRTMDKMRRAEIQVTAEYQKRMEYLIESGQIRQAQLETVREISSRMGGAAETVLTTVGGRWDKIEQKSNDFMQQVGIKFGQALLPVAEAFWDEARVDSMMKFIDRLIPIAVDFGYYLTDALDSALDMASKFIDELEGMLRVLGDVPWEAIFRAISPLDPHAFRPMKAAFGAFEGTMEVGPVEGLKRAWKAMTNAASETEKQNRRTVESEKERALSLSEAQEKQMRYNAAQKKMTMAEYQAYLVDQARTEELEKQQEVLAADAARMRSRLETLSTNMESPIQKLERYSQMLSIYRDQVSQLADAEQNLAWARKLETRIVQDFIQNANKQYDQFISKFQQQVNPQQTLRADFEAIQAVQGGNEDKRRAALTELLRAIEKRSADLRKKEDEKPFSPVTASIDNLYSSIRDTLLAKDPTVNAIEKQTREQLKFLDQLKQEVIKAMTTMFFTGPRVRSTTSEWTDRMAELYKAAKAAGGTIPREKWGGLSPEEIELQEKRAREHKQWQKQTMDRGREEYMQQREEGLQRKAGADKRTLDAQTRSLDASNMAAADLVVEAIENIDVGLGP